MKKWMITAGVLFAVVVGAEARTLTTDVRTVMYDFELGAQGFGRSGSSALTLSQTTQDVPDLGMTNSGALKLSVNSSVDASSWFSIYHTNEIKNVNEVRFWIKTDKAEDLELSLKLVDFNGQKLYFAIPLQNSSDWQQVIFPVPAIAYDHDSNGSNNGVYCGFVQSFILYFTGANFLAGDAVYIDQVEFSEPRVGATAHINWECYDDSETYLNQYLYAVIEQGLPMVRLAIPWHRVEPDGKGQYDTEFIGHLTNSINQLLTNHVQILLTIGFCPAWASDSSTTSINAVPVDIADWRDYITFVANTLGLADKVRYWTVWNEPNMYDDGEYHFDGTCSDFYNLVSNAVDIIKTAQPNTLVAGGAYAGSPSQVLEQAAWLTNAAATGIFGLCDYYDVHSYRLDEGFILNHIWWTNFMTDVGMTLPMVVTEFGWTSSGDSELEEQKAYCLREGLYLFTEKYPEYYDKALVYVQANKYTGDLTQRNFGISTTDFTALPAFYSFCSPNAAVTDFRHQSEHPGIGEKYLTLYERALDETAEKFIYQQNWFDGMDLVIPGIAGGSRRAGFRVNDSWLYGNNDGLDTNLTIDVTYLDSPAGDFKVNMVAADGSWLGYVITRAGSPGYKTASLQFENINFTNRVGNVNADFQIDNYVGTGDPVYIHEVSVHKKSGARVSLLQSPNAYGEVWTGRHLIFKTSDESSDLKYSAVTNFEGQACRQFDYGKKLSVGVSDTYVYTDVNQVTLRLELYDPGITDFGEVSYSDQSGGTSAVRFGGGTTGWKTVELTLSNVLLDNSKWGRDLFIYSRVSGVPLYVRSVEIIP